VDNQDEAILQWVVEQQFQAMECQKWAAECRSVLFSLNLTTIANT